MGHQFEGKHGRVFYLDGRFDPRDLLMREIRGEYDKYVDGDGQDSDGKMITLEGRETGTILVAGMGTGHRKGTSLTVLVSTQGDLRDEIRTLVQNNVNHNVRFLELEYQP